MSSQIFSSTDVREITDRKVQIRRTFKAGKELVFRAYTVPSLVQQWMTGPPGWEMTVCEMDLREGGAYRWRWKNVVTHAEFGFDGVFRLVRVAETIVHAQIFDPGSLGGDMGQECVLTVTFREAGGLTTVTTVIEYQSAEDMKTALSTGMTGGMELSFQSLDRLLQTTKG